MRDGAVAAFFVLCALVAQRSLVPELGAAVYSQSIPGNDSLLHVWTLAWGQHALWTQPTNPFDGNIFWPNAGTALYSDHLLGLAALLAPLRLATDNVVLVHNLAVLLAPVVNAVVVHRLALDVTGSRAGAIVAGVVYAFAPMRFAADRGQIQMLVAWWMPLLLLAARRALVSGRWRPALVAGFALAMQGWTAVYLLALFAPVVALAHAWWLRTFPARAHRRAWGRLLLAEALGVLAILPSLAAYRGVQQLLGSSRSVVVNALLSFTPQLVVVLLPSVTFAVLVTVLILGWRRLGAPTRSETTLWAIVVVATILLGLGPAIALPFDLGAIRGPYALLLGLPGYDALRAPGRMLHVALLGLAMLAAAGMALLPTLLPARARRPAVGAVALLLAWECWTPAFPTQATPPPAAMSPAYAWLAEQAGPIRLVELPFARDGTFEQRIQYASTGHWHPIVNGNMGIGPPLHAYLARRFLEAPMTDVLEELAALGVTHVLVHTHVVPEPLATRLAKAETARPPRLREHRRWGDAVVYEITASAGLTEVEAPTLDRRGWRARASENTPDVALAFDDDEATAWSSWGALERGLAAWWQPGPFPARWDAFLDRQPVRFTVDLGALRTVRAVHVTLAGSDPMVATLLRLETSADGSTWTRAAARLVAVPDAPSLAVAAARQRYAFVLDRPVHTRHVRLRCHGLDWRIAELAVDGA